MKKIVLFFATLFAISMNSNAQELTWSPQFPTYNSLITITLHSSLGNAALAGNTTGPIYVHIGVITTTSASSSAWEGAPVWLTNTTQYQANLVNGNWTFTISPSSFAWGTNPAVTGTPLRIAILFRDATGTNVQKNADGSDMFVPLYSGTNNIRITTPPSQPTFIRTLQPITPAPTAGTSIPVTAVSSVSGALTLSLNGTQFATTTGTTISGNATAVNGNNQIIASLNGTAFDTVSFYIPPTTLVAPLPAGVQEGINYYGCTDSVTLVLYAPHKTNCMLIGDFAGSNWTSQTQYQMNKTPDSSYYWITVHGLTSGTEYAYQYLVDNSIYIADPYTEKVLDPWLDQYISPINYPNLRAYPTQASAGTNGIVSVLQTCAPQYNWKVTNFSKPDKRNLMIYELLVRDFSARKTTYQVIGNYQDVIDSIKYLKNLGINAVEFMPLDQFSGDDSWGYNPEYHFATAKTYGTKNKLKELIDSLHSNGMAAIVDEVWDDLASTLDPEAKLYWNSTTSLPASNNPWLNPFKETCPYGVFQNEDINHSAPATQYWVERSLEHWITEFKVDGFRFDLAKGFSNQWLGEGVYDAPRVANLERYYDTIVGKFPNTYMILEFLGGTPSSEEQEYAKHGFLLWGEMWSAYTQCAMGYNSSDNIGPLVWNYSSRAYPSPNLVGYPESHDKERMQYQNEAYGNVSGSYNVKTLATGLERMEAVGATLFTVPGPKMIWQFEERGYDSSIASNGGNTSDKLPMWNYMNNANRKHLYNSWATMIKFRLAHPSVFTNTPISYDYDSNLFKVFEIGDPVITNPQVVVVANFDVVSGTKTVNFPTTGAWYNLISNTGVGTLTSTGGLNGSDSSTFTLSSNSQSITLAPGEYHIYVSGAPCATVAPTASSPVTYCQNATASTLTATGTSLLWYTVASGGTGSSTAPTPITTVAGNTIYYVSQTLNGCEGPRAAITVTVNATPAAPTVTTPVNYCKNSTASALTATGTGLLWYSTSTGGSGSSTAPTPLTTTVGSILYYVSQTISGCESPRATITVTTNAIPSAPTVTTPVSYCQNASATALTATGTGLLWYTTATGGTGSSTATTPSTTTVGNTTYYVSQTSTGCESPRAAITVTINAIPTAPTVSTPVSYCQNATASALTATGTGLLWYTTATGGTGNSTAPTPTTTTIGNTTYYVSQTTTGCESPRASITVTITAGTPAPTVSTPVTYCKNSTASALTATGTSLLWYASATSGSGSSTAPIPSTTTVGSTTYYVSQTQSCGESPRASITVTVNAVPTEPTVSTPVIYCQNTTASILGATGTDLLWYTVATGGTSSSTAPTPSTSSVGNINYYVSQTTNGCESPRASITVSTNAIPEAPTVSTPVAYCQNATASALTATGSGLLWYTVATGGNSSSTTPTPSTTTVGNTVYYVSQTTNGCESPRAAITVAVNATPAAPAVTTPVSYCQNATASALSATGTGLLWYTVATGGSSSSTAPTPSTTSVGNTIYYVSQTTTGCESPRASITVTINAIPNAPSVNTPVNYCQNTTATALTANGTGLLWYTTSTGGSGSSTAPTPLTTTVGSTTYYVSQTATGCESPRAAIAVVINVIPSAPTVITPISYCQNATASALTANGSNLVWYTTATGGTGSSSAPTPSTTTIGSTLYYVSQSTSGCESPRASITVTITAGTPMPTVTTPVNYCQNTTATQLTASGTSLLWYTTATGGTGSSTSPTPLTTTVGSTTYYVSQTQSCGESPRAAITVTINAVPTAPTVTTPLNYCQNTTPSVLNASGTGLLWYAAVTGGIGSSTAPTPSTSSIGSTNYYVSQTTNGCESPRSDITVTVNAVPTAPTVSSTPVSYCQNVTASALTATGTGLLWYSAATGGSGSSTAPTPVTSSVGNTTYYVSQTTNGCESPRSSIEVIVNSSTVAPIVTTPVIYCQNVTATALSATGTTLLWYTTATGGIGSSTAPTPSTSTVGNVSYYVSQTSGCGEGPRALITVTTNAIPSAPSVTTPVAYCQNTTASELVATGTNLMWYTTLTGGTGSLTAPIPSTTTVGSTINYVSQTITGCESPRASITVTINITPVAPSVTTPVGYCQNATVSALTAEGTNLLWYTASTGGAGSSTAIIPSTSTAGTTEYYVSQTTGTCEGPRATITVNVNPLTTTPTVEGPVTYCQNAIATALTATGTNLLWYTTATGGTGNETAPTPSTVNANTVTYYVSQTGTCGESTRSSIAVTVTASPVAPSNLTASEITNTGAVLSWGSVAGAMSYTVSYKATTDLNWTTAIANTTLTTYTITGLNRGISYSWKVSSNCDEITPGLSDSSTFSTLSYLINNVKNGLGIMVYPNPATSTSKIAYIVPSNGMCTIVLYNSIGQILDEVLDANVTAGQYEIPLSDWMISKAHGIYFLRITQNGLKNYTKFIKP